MLSIIMGIVTVFGPCQSIVLTSLLCHGGNYFINTRTHFRWIISMFFATAEFILLANATVTGIQCWSSTEECNILMDRLQDFCKPL